MEGVYTNYHVMDFQRLIMIGFQRLICKKLYAIKITIVMGFQRFIIVNKKLHILIIYMHSVQLGRNL